MKAVRFGQARIAKPVPCEACGAQIPAGSSFVVVTALPGEIRNSAWLRWRFCTYEHLAQRAEQERLAWERMRATNNVAYEQNPQAADLEIQALQSIEDSARSAPT